MGSSEFSEAQEHLVDVGPDQFLLDVLAKSHAAIDEWQTEMLLKALRSGRVQLYTGGLNERQLALTGVEAIQSMPDAIAASVKRSGDPRVAVIPEGPYVIPTYREPVTT